MPIFLYFKLEAKKILFPLLVNFRKKQIIRKHNTFSVHILKEDAFILSECRRIVNKTVTFYSYLLLRSLILVSLSLSTLTQEVENN